MQVGPRNNKVIVIAPFVGTPAYRAGIHPGDVIIAVDGKPTDNTEHVQDVADLLKGPKGTHGTYHRRLREGTPKPLDFTVTRDEIPRYSALTCISWFARALADMHVSGFQETTGARSAGRRSDEMGDLKGPRPRSSTESRRIC